MCAKMHIMDQTLSVGGRFILRLVVHRFLGRPFSIEAVHQEPVSEEPIPLLLFILIRLLSLPPVKQSS